MKCVTGFTDKDVSALITPAINDWQMNDKRNEKRKLHVG
ncbi:MAG: hypothetical protein ACJAYE_001504 [Candidatus Azotimanducaceae bacterium]|jgi:hypothetical protein